MKKPSAGHRRLRPLIEELEPRVLMSAADLQSVLVEPSLGDDERTEDPAAQLELLQTEAKVLSF